MSQEEKIKKGIQQEFIRCAKDPIHFMKKYCYIQHPQRGRIKFNLYPFQERVLNLFIKNDYSIVNKSRQLGLSTLCAGYALWLILFQKDKNILCIATKQDTAKNMVKKVKVMYNNLPSWLKVPHTSNNELSLILKNGSQIKASSANPEAGRSEAVSLLLLDEAAFIEKIDRIWAAAQQTLATGGKCIALSTPNGSGNWFHKTWVRAQTGENNFIPIRLPWQVHPERDQAWRDAQDEELGDKRIAAQECDCDFSTSGHTVIEADYLKYYDSMTIDPVERRGVDSNYWIWEYPDYSRTYLIVVDVSRGDGNDYSAFHIIDVETMNQVAEYKGKIDPKSLGHLLLAVGNEYNEALISVENNNLGWSTISVLVEKAYPNIYHTPSGDMVSSYYDQYMDKSGMTPGFTMSSKTRPMVVSKLQEYAHDKSLTINSKRTMEEAKVFIWVNGKPQAQSGYNDDLMMPLGMACYIRDYALRFRKNGMDMSEAILRNMSVNRTQAKGIYFSKGSDNPYHMPNGRGDNEDISWLI